MAVLTATQARRIAVTAQGFAEAKPRGSVTRAHLRRLIGRIQVLQLDSVSVAVRAHYAPVFSRLGPYDRDILDRAAWSHSVRSPRLLVEYWAHEAALWLLLVSGPGNAKTETVTALSRSPGVHIISTIASEGALLSATSKGECAKNATGWTAQRNRGPGRGGVERLHVHPVPGTEHPTPGAGRAPRDLRRVLEAHRRCRRRSHPGLGRAHSSHRGRNDSLGSKARRRGRDGRSVRAAADGLAQPPAGRWSAGHQQHRQGGADESRPG
jgi:hypothetical protein